MIAGLMLAITAGSLVGIQTIFNSKVSERAGSWATTALVLGLGFAASLVLGLLFEGKGMFVLHDMQLWYWFSGVIGVGVVISLVNGIRLLGPTLGVSIMLSSQLGFALLWDSFGWLGLEKVPFTPAKLLGVLIIVGGIVLFKWSGGRQAAKSAETTEFAEST
ncbi:transporter family-2 protein [Paenibacillus endophyticus]|uniref:Transporter family-2 protein n=1 Tax=Paenibacillus endophyticus TaxID=1294268 RepID=A0A7W5CD19_9BACL|nr:DMT family transporter [Paenibacillus endophyticus]MBB3155493.1 transporter family-2 protein [Paenibacillus endophyticus]